MTSKGCLHFSLFLLKSILGKMENKGRNGLLESRKLANEIVTMVEDKYPGQSYSELMIKHEALSLAFHLINGTDALQDLVAGFSLRQFPKNYILNHHDRKCQRA